MVGDPRSVPARVRQLISAGSVSLDELAGAEHEADLLAHPYIGVKHVELARLRLAGKEGERAALLRRVSQAYDAAGGGLAVRDPLFAKLV